jgi:hypothetical protein
MNIKDFMWLAGLMEGEGCFMFIKGARLQLSMTDRDVVERAAPLLRAKIRAPLQRVEGRRLVHTCYTFGPDAIGMMMMLYQFMGKRRKAKIRDVIAKWKASPQTPRANGKGKRFMATCHPDRIRAGRGLCSSCYMLEWRKRLYEGIPLKNYYGAEYVT